MKERNEEHKLFTSCLAWISNLDFHELYRERCDDHLSGTGDWFLNSMKYQDWRTSNQSSLLWVQGTAGSGKSMLSAITITEVNNDTNPDIGVAYALCQRNQQDTQTIVALLRAMIKQLAVQRHEFHPKVIEAYNQSGFGKILERDQAFDLLAHTASLFDEIYLIVDALDEFMDPERLITGMLDMLKEDRRSKRCIKLLILNRPTSHMEKLLSPHYNPIRPEAENKQDIDRYIEVHLPRPEDDKARELCSEKANGMFMWVRLVFENSGGWLTELEDIVEVLNSMPQGLDEIYDIIFKDISSQPNRLRQKAWNVLYWILKAYRPLTWKMMLAATANYNSLKQLSQLETNSTTEDLIELCKHLICIDQKGEFSFIHESVRWYLEQKTPESETLKQFQAAGKEAHDNMTLVCLKYLQLKDFDHEIPCDVREMSLLIQPNPFREYAALCWGRHARDGDSASHKRAIVEYLRSTLRREFSLQLMEFYRSPVIEPSFWYHPGTTSALHVAALFDLPSVLSEILETELDQYRPDGAGITPLMYALQYCTEDTVLSFLDLALAARSTELQIRDMKAAWAIASGRGWINLLAKLHSIHPEYLDQPVTLEGHTPLIVACLSNNELAARKLVELGADVSLEAPSKRIPLITAADSGLIHLVSLFLKYGADPNIQDQDGYTALHMIVRYDAEIAVEALLKGGANIMLVSKVGRHTAIHRAAANNSALTLYAMARLHGSHGFSVTNEYGMTPLHLACQYNAIHAAETLMALGCPVDAANIQGRTALQMAIQFASIDMLKLLLLNRASVAKVEENGRTSLHIAAILLRVEHLKTLLEWVPKPQLANVLAISDKSGATPLHLACQAGCEDSVRLLITNGADCNAREAFASLPLHIAARSGHAHLITLLLPETKDVNATSTGGNTVLHFAAVSGSKECLQQLLEVSAKLGITLDPTIVNGYNKTPLFSSVSDRDRAGPNSDNAVTEILLPLTPETTLRNRDSGGNEILHLAAWYGDESLVRFLLEHHHGAAASKGYKNRLPIHCAILCGHLKVFELLLSHSLPYLEEVCEGGRTALVLALCCKRDMILHRLLDCRVNLDVTDNHGNSPLHVAAYSGDQDLFERLIDLGCRGFEANQDGMNPLHSAIRRGSIRMVRALRRCGFSDVMARDILGRNAGIYAMEVAHPLIINELKTMGVPLDTPDSFGMTSPHYAAQFGHMDTLKDLEQHGVDIYTAAPDGVTPFLIAASHGYTQIVKYCLDAKPSVISDHELWSGETALIFAADIKSTSITNLLLEKGMDPKRPNTFAFTPTDLISMCPDNEQASFILDIQTRDNLQRELIEKCLLPILLYQSPISNVDAFKLQNNLTRLSRALRLHGDIQMAKLCMYTWAFEDGPLLSSSHLSCDACFIPKIKQKIFACSSCHKNWYLCEECHEDYLSAGKSTPKALVALYHLERRVGQVRQACAHLTDVLDVIDAVYVFPITTDFIRTMLASYEQWEKDHRAETRYTFLERYGQQWLKLVHAYIELQSRVDPVTQETVTQETVTQETARQFLKEAKSIIWQYEVLIRKDVLDRDWERFRCRGHEYIKMTRMEYEELKSGSKLYDSETGQPTRKLIDQIVAKYHVKGVDPQVKTQSLPSESSSSDLVVDSLMQPDHTPDHLESEASSDPARPNASNSDDPSIGQIQLAASSPNTDMDELSATKADNLDGTVVAKVINQNTLEPSPANSDQRQSSSNEQEQAPQLHNRDDIKKIIDTPGIQNAAERKRALKLVRILETFEEPMAIRISNAIKIAEAVHPGFTPEFIDHKYAELFERKAHQDS